MIKRLSPGIALVCLLVVVAGCGSAPPTPLIDASVATSVPASLPSAPMTAMPGVPTATAHTSPPTPTLFRLSQKIDVGGYGLSIRCSGDGQPTVVFDSGLGGPSTVWVMGGKPTWLEVATFARACIYDRAGLGQSDRAPKPRTSQQIVTELHTLLHKAGVAAPYVLVGHSFGGYNVRLYTSQYPQEVVGMVLVDSSHEDQVARLRELVGLLPPEAPGESQEMQQWRKELVGDNRDNPEGVDLEASAAQVRAARTAAPLPDIPLIVLTARLGTYPPEVPKQVRERLEQIWQELQADLARLVPHSKHIIVEKSHHCIQCEQPQVVTTAIRQVVEAVRSGSRVDVP